jgi:hypothetical protein
MFFGLSFDVLLEERLRVVSFSQMPETISFYSQAKENIFSMSMGHKGVSDAVHGVGGGGSVSRIETHQPGSDPVMSGRI